MATPNYDRGRCLRYKSDLQVGQSYLQWLDIINRTNTMLNMTRQYLFLEDTDTSIDRACACARTTA
jgi:hypothetical protein